MQLTHNIFLEQQQKLLITPELRQSIAVLQMSTLELAEYIQKELEENPCLEERDEPEEADKQAQENENIKIEEWLEVFHDRDIGFTPWCKDKEKTFEHFLTRRPTLCEHLEFQLHIASQKEEDLVIGKYLIGGLDNNGYLGIDLNEAAAKLNTSRDKVEEALELIKSFHPHGVGAGDLAECLLLQLRHYGKESDMVRAIINDHLGDLARGKLNKIARALAVPVEEVQDICDLIRTLDPKPGLQYSSGNEIKYLLPDAFVEKVEGEYVVIINDFHFPRLIINRAYESLLRQPNSLTPDAKKYLEDKMGSAFWLIRSVEHRRVTLYEVARCIVDIQTGFLDHGVEHMKPLNLKQVADIVGVHESTVSRATSNKYIQTPQGLFELKYFFSSGVESYQGNQKVSSKSIKHMLEEIVAAEDSARPLSDDAITKILNKKGIKISRRTVTKYRQQLGIFSAMLRRRY